MYGFGPNPMEIWALAATYVDRMLKGAKVARPVFGEILPRPVANGPMIGGRSPDSTSAGHVDCRARGESMATSRIPDDVDVVRGILYATLFSLALWSLVWVLLSFLTTEKSSF